MAIEDLNGLNQFGIDSGKVRPGQRPDVLRYDGVGRVDLVRLTAAKIALVTRRTVEWPFNDVLQSINPIQAARLFTPERADEEISQLREKLIKAQEALEHAILLRDTVYPPIQHSNVDSI